MKQENKYHERARSEFFLYIRKKLGMSGAARPVLKRFSPSHIFTTVHPFDKRTSLLGSPILSTTKSTSVDAYR